MSKYKVDICGIDTGSLEVIKNQEMKEMLKTYAISKDPSLKEKMILGNLKLVLSIVSRFQKRTDNLDDLFQVGVVGLIKAIDHFNIEVEVQFSTYAVPLIIGEIKRYLRDSSPIKISRTLRDHAYLIMIKKDQFIKEYYREPTDKELIELTGLSLVKIHEALNSLSCVSSMFEKIKGSENENISLEDQIADKKEDMEHVFNCVALHDALDELGKDERWLIYQRYYLDKTQNEIAGQLHISQAQVSRYEKNIIMHLRQLLS